MARRNINIFSVSFLDLMSGALGAVIILYILVPKINIPLDVIEEQQKITAEVGKLGVQIDDIKNLIPSATYDSIQNQMNQIIDAKKELDGRVAQLEKALDECLEASQKNFEKIKELEQKIEALERENNQLLRDKERLEAELANCPPPCPDCPDCPPIPECPECPVCPEERPDVDVGFKFSGKSIVFLIDVSSSMDDDDKIGQVKAGLKMLITTMNSDYKLDVVAFPGTGTNDFNSLWSSLRTIDDYNKLKVFKFLNSLDANGGTPTGTTIRYALSNYPGLTDIVLLTDGVPNTDEQQIISYVSRNANNVRVNTIGVGPEYTSNTSSSKVQFLQDLASSTGGFFVGF